MAAVAQTTSNSMIRQVSANPPASEGAARSLPVQVAAATYMPQGTTYQSQGNTYQIQGTTYPSSQGTTYPAPTQVTSYPTQGTTYPTQGTTYPAPTQVTTYPGPTQVTTTSYPTSYPTTTISSSIPREHTTIHGNTTMTTYPGTQGTTTMTTTGSLAPHDSAIQNAINQGRIYSPVDAVYVPSGLALKSSMHTIYDSKMIPTFEAPLTFQRNPSTLVTGPMITQGRAVTEASSHITGKSNKFVVHQKKSACC